jgi:hypothetical protein
MSSRLKNISAFFLSVIFCLFFGELYLRWMPPSWLPFFTYPPVQQTHSEPSSNPVLRYVPKANFQKAFRSHEFATQVSINSRHMRDREFSKEKTNRLRIATLGDSFVFGWGVEAHESAVKILEARYKNNVEVLNFGVSGYCSNQVLEWLKTQAVSFQPDIVLFFTPGNPSTCVTDVKFDDGQMYWAWVPRENAWQKLRSALAHRSYLFNLVLTTVSERLSTIRLQLSGDKTEPLPDALSDPNQGLDILAELKRLSKEKGFVPVIVHYHDDKEVWEGFGPDEKAQLAAMTAFTQREGLWFLDIMKPLKEAWEKSGRSPYFRYDPHWNTWGHEIAARALEEFLEKKKLLPAEKFKKAAGTPLPAP